MRVECPAGVSKACGLSARHLGGCHAHGAAVRLCMSAPLAATPARPCLEEQLLPLNNARVGIGVERLKRGPNDGWAAVHVAAGCPAGNFHILRANCRPQRGCNQALGLAVRAEVSAPRLLRPNCICALEG